VGLGQMGSRMAKNLLKAGHHLVVHDAVPEAARGLGASSDTLTVAESPAELMSILAASPTSSSGEGALVVSMLPNSSHVSSVYTGEGGLLLAPPDVLRSTLGPNLTLIDCSTIDPVVAREIGAAARACSATFADAPVSGGVVGAEAATLTFMVGADSGEELSRCSPLLEMMGKSVVHCGPVGSGQAVKLCNNLVLAISMAGVAEGMLLGQRLGVDKQVTRCTSPPFTPPFTPMYTTFTASCGPLAGARECVQHVLRPMLVVRHIQPLPRYVTPPSHPIGPCPVRWMGRTLTTHRTPPSHPIGPCPVRWMGRTLTTHRTPPSHPIGPCPGALDGPHPALTLPSPCHQLTCSPTLPASPK
jgi:3-hydroxyisobutyrate dehydrogenase-like beta-hydroxyacid dehydrogenase